MNAATDPSRAALKSLAERLRAWGENDADPAYFQGDALSCVLLDCGAAGEAITKLLAEKTGPAPTTAGRDPGRAAYGSRFAHARPRDVEPWDSLTPEVRAIWARVEAASRVGGAVYTGDTRQLHADLLMAADELARMAAHAKTLGPKGAVWVESPDLLIALYRNAAVALATADRDSSEYADAMDARMADAITMERIGAALAVFARMNAMDPPEGVRLNDWLPAVTAARAALKEAGLQRLLDPASGTPESEARSRA